MMPMYGEVQARVKQNEHPTPEVSDTEGIRVSLYPAAMAFPIIAQGRPPH
jgi:hypothetical protein